MRPSRHRTADVRAIPGELAFRVRDHHDVGASSCTPCALDTVQPIVSRPLAASDLAAALQDRATLPAYPR